MGMKCVIVDDEQFAIDSIISYCREISGVEINATFVDPYKAQAYLEFNTPDVLFLDIQMPGISGLQIAKCIKNRAMVIFTTAYAQYAIDGFNLNVVDYLLKPFGRDRLSEAIEKAKGKYIDRNLVSPIKGEGCGYITVKVEYVNVKIDTSGILYIEAMDNYCRIFTVRKVITTRMSLKTLLSLLPENEFIQVHKSYVVSISKLVQFTKGYVIIEDKVIPVGRTFSKNIIFLKSKS